MKKSLILLGMLSIGYAYAQEGNVGINTENPKATLEVLPNSANLTKTTNEGIIAPKLTKARIAGIADANLVEGTLVYATDTVYTAENATTPTAKDSRVAKITEKGYYYYNGVEWIQARAIWQKQANGDVKLVDNEVNADIRYTASGYKVKPIATTEPSYTIRDMPVNTNVIRRRDDYSGYNNQLLFSSQVKPGNLEANHRAFNNHLNIINGNETGQNLNFYGNRRVLATDVTMTSPQNRLWGSVYYVQHNSPTKVNEIITVPTFTTISKDSSADTMVAISNQFESYSDNPLNSVKGVYNHMFFRGSSNIASLSGQENVIRITRTSNEGTAPTIANLYGIKNDIIGGGTNPSNITNLYGAKFTTNLPETVSVVNNYGLHIGDVKNGTSSNYSIYTNAGQVRFGDLADTSATTDRTVVVDKDGVLKVGTATASTPAPAVAIGSTSSMECNASNRGKMNFIQGTDGKSDVFGICMKNADGNYYWGYMVGGNNPTNGTGAFGSGL